MNLHLICILVLILKATDSKMKHHVQRRRVNPCGTAPCSAPRIKGNSRNVTLALQSEILRCRASGNPPPTITWERNGVRIDDKDTKFHIKTYPQTNRNSEQIVVSKLTVTPQQVAVYTCIARNDEDTVRSKDYHVRLDKGARSAHSNGDYREMCIPVRNITNHCADYLDPTRHVYTDGGIGRVRRREHILNALNRNLPDYQGMGAKCEPHVRPFLCYYNFPYCDDDAPKEQPKKITVCKQDCVRLSRGICQKEMQQAKAEETIKMIIPHDCDDLRGDNCIFMQDEVKKTEEKRRKKTKANPNRDQSTSVVDPMDNCFFNKGELYRGTINQSADQLQCKPWPSTTNNQLLQGHNYCRNIDGLRERPWCYVNGAPNGWAYCDVLECATPLRTQPSDILYTIIPCLVFALALSLAIIMVAWKRHKQHYYQSAPTSPKQLVPRVNPKIQELNREDLCDFRLLGDGCIGRVYTADFTGCKDGRTFTACVAVKAIIEKATQKQIEDFVREAETRGNFKHENVVTLVGVISREEPLSLVYEYTEYGDLHEYLLRHSPNFSEAHANDDNGQLEYPDLLVISTQIASGMSYLSTHAFVHKDLAARNCLVAENGCIKISDFSGLRDLYAGDYYRAPGRPPLPVRWMSPEAISSSCFTSASDVWSYGIVLWEIFSYGSRPLFGLSNYQAMQVIAEHDLLLPSPEHCSTAIFNTMKECWAIEPDARPTFVEIYNRLKAMDDVTLITNSIPRQEELSLPSVNGTLPVGGEYVRGDVAVNDYVRGEVGANEYVRGDMGVNEYMRGGDVGVNDFVRGGDVGVNASAFHRPSLSASQSHSLHSGQSSNHSTGSGHHPGSIHSASHSIPPSLLSMSHSVPSSCMLKKMGGGGGQTHGHYPLPSHDGRQSLPRDTQSREQQHCMATRERGCGRPSSANSVSHQHRSPVGGAGVYHPPASYISSLHSYPTSVGCPTATMFSRHSSTRLSNHESSGYDSISRNNQSAIPHVYL